ncbi:uncharacterized protein LOC114130223 [Aphis gossypii]|uniref:uncharacterized protein LOC114130223 n=1 Tax=Aphis gossypii TaxID=80765 RepID=UPI00215960F2|nr:uncharacterized protein LOC114130223 [Aphis gossypii]
MMKPFIFILFFSLSVFQNGYACFLCKFGLKPLNTSVIVTKSNIDRPKTLHEMTVEIENSISIKTSSEHHTTKHDTLTPIKCAEDFIKCSSQNSLVNSSLDEKKKIIVATITSLHDHMVVPLPPEMVINLFNMLACSPPELFSMIPPQCMNSVVLILSINQCALGEIPPKNIVSFLNGLLSLSPGVLNNIPKASFISILGMASSTEIFNNLTHLSAMNLITVLSMSKSTVSYLPLPTLISLLNFIECKSFKELLNKLPPSTTYGFLEGLLVTLDGSSPFLINTIPTSVLVSIISPIMTARWLGVMSIDNFDLLISVMGSSHKLLKALPPTNFDSIFSILISSPKILSSLKPNNVNKLLITLATCPSILQNIPLNPMHQLLNAINDYLPSSLVCISESEFSLLVKERN